MSIDLASKSVWENELRISANYNLRQQGVRWRRLAHHELLIEQLARVIVGEINRLIIMMPPRHGKTFNVCNAMATWLLHEPSLKIAATAYGGDLAEKVSVDTQRFYQNFAGQMGKLDRLSLWNTKAGGRFRAVSVGGQITGKGDNVLLLDDPMKGTEQADSARNREKSWDWYSSDFRSRLDTSDGRIICIGTRWHEDDVIGRILNLEASFQNADDPGREGWVVVLVDMEFDPEYVLELQAKLPHNELVYLPRARGERLKQFSDKSISQSKATHGPRAWACTHQQRPVPRAGLMFDAEQIKTIKALPAEIQPAASVRAWDLARSTSPSADRTVGTLMHMYDIDGRSYWVIEHVHAGRWNPTDRHTEITATAERDGPEVFVLIEQATSKERTQALLSAVAPSPCDFIKPVGDKAQRAEGFSAQVGAGNVKIVYGGWNHDFREEIRSFPAVGHDDFVDSAVHAFNWLALRQPESTWEDLLEVVG